jgi:hypothetical protein
MTQELCGTGSYLWGSLQVANPGLSEIKPTFYCCKWAQSFWDEKKHQNFLSSEGARERVFPHTAGTLLTGTVAVPSASFCSYQQPPGPGGLLGLSHTASCLIPKDNWFLGENWTSTDRRIVPRSALAACQILTFWRDFATQLESTGRPIPRQ